MFRCNRIQLTEKAPQLSFGWQRGTELKLRNYERYNSSNSGPTDKSEAERKEEMEQRTEERLL